MPCLSPVHLCFRDFEKCDIFPDKWPLSVKSKDNNMDMPAIRRLIRINETTKDRLTFEQLNNESSCLRLEVKIY